VSYCVYAIIDPRDDGIFYVGQTRNLPRRRAEHVEGTDSLSGLQIRQMKQNGFVPLFVCLERCRDGSAALMAEIFWIELMKARGVRLANAQAFAGYAARGAERRRKVAVLTAMEQAKLKAVAGGKPARETLSWSDRDVARLKGMVKSGMDVAAMADALQRSMGSVRAKLRVLRLKTKG
jgi:predicted GIY-YIG superfamily endonuclease